MSDYARYNLDRTDNRRDKRERVKEIVEIVRGMNAKVELLSYSEKAWTGLEYAWTSTTPWTVREIMSGAEGGKGLHGLFGKGPVVDKWTFSTNGIMTCGIYGIPTSVRTRK